MKKYEIIKMLFLDVIAAFILAVSVDVFAVNANFAPGGVSGIAVIVNYLFKIPIGFAIILINIPIILLTFKKLGKNFFLLSIKSIIICSIFLDYIVCYIPQFTGNRLIASILSGICAGIGYSILFNVESSTGGTDFIIVAIKKWRENLSFGLLAFVMDSIVIVVSVFIFKEIQAFIYGMIYTIITSIALDITTKVIEKIKNHNKINKYSVL